MRGGNAADLSKIVPLFLSLMFTAGACTTIIQELDEHDSKARYRRGRAYLLLGMTKCAKDDFMFILKSPYSTQEGVCAARLGLQELRQVLNKSETEAKLTVCRGLEGSLFSRGRLAAAHVRQLGAADDPDKSDDDQFHFSRNYPEDKTDFHLPPSKTTAEAANSCNSADGQGVESISKAATCDEAETQDKHTVRFNTNIHAGRVYRMITSQH